MHTPTLLQSNRLGRSWVSSLVLLLLVVTGFSSFAQSITGPDYVYVNISKSPTGATTTYGAFNGSTAPGGPFAGQNLGSYMLGGGNTSDEVLLFNGGRVVTSEPNTGNTARVRSAQLYYRVYSQATGSNGVPFAALDLPEDLTKTVVGSTTTTRTFNLDNAGIDWVGSVSSSGTYTVELYLQANYQNASGTIIPISPTDNNGGTNYIANFRVTGDRGNTTIWMGGVSDNWFDGGNWSAGAPTSTKDAFIRYPNAGSMVPYPRIYANGTYQRPTGNTTFPTYSNMTYGAAEVRNISFGGASATARATSELVTGNLFIYGNLTNNFDNITQDANTFITFASTMAQALDGGGTFKTVCISGGGKKSLTGNMKIANELHFGPPTDFAVNTGLTLPAVTGRGELAVVTASSNNVVTLQAIPNTNTVANITSETDAGYVSGLVNTQAVATPGVAQNFGNIGITLTFTGNAPGTVAVNRNVGQYYTGTNNSPNSVSIKRSFEVNPEFPSTATGGLNATVVFRYLDTERMLVGSSNVTVSENALYLAYSSNSTSFSAIGTTVSRDQTANTVTTSNVNSFAIFTLADTQNPLPVSLVAFNAKRSGELALITWETAMERNNKGFEVEVSTDGTTFRTLGFVASNTPDSDKRLAYSYNDTEANKSGIRYYRLHQLDYSGKDDYSPVRAVSFAAAGEGIAALSAYPNPFSSDEIKLALQSSEAGQAKLVVTDLLGRPVSAQTFAAVKGVTEVSIDQASQLAAGSYLAQITAPSGEVKTVRIQKR